VMHETLTADPGYRTQLNADLLRCVEEARGLDRDEAYRVRCPECGTLISEYFVGVLKFKCRGCHWVGIVARCPWTMVESRWVIYEANRIRLERATARMPRRNGS